MVARAVMNAQSNGISNATFQCANLEDTGAMDNLVAHRVNKR